MAISYVGGTTATFAASAANVSLTGLTGGSDAAAATGDLVCVISGAPETADTNVSVTTTGYTNQELYANDTRDANGVFAYKFMGATPDTTVTVPATSTSTARGSVVVRVYRGVDQTTPMDVAITTATGANGDRANSPSITPVTTGAEILAAGFATNPASTSGTATGPSNMADFVTVVGVGTGRSSIAGMASQAWAGGAFDPNAWTATTNNANDSWVAFTVALRPAATAITGDASGSMDFTGASAGTVAVQGAASGSFDVTASATGQILASGAASSTFALDGTATGTIGSTSISGAADVTLDFSLSATGVGPIIIRSADPDAPSWKQLFYDKQLKEFEDSLDEIVSADDPQEAAQEAVEAFQPLETPSPIIRDNLQAISEALRGMTMRSLRRKELQAEIADIRAELARVAEYRRKRRNNEAALLLLL